MNAAQKLSPLPGPTPSSATLPLAQPEEFFSQFLEIGPAEPNVHFRSLCDAWKMVSGADWVWLWLYNKHKEGGGWELVARSSGDQLPLKSCSLVTDTGVTEYCCRSEKPVLVENIEAWNAVLEGVQYTVQFSPCLKEMGSPSFVSVPAPMPVIPQLQHCDSLAMRGVICLHYRNRRTEFPLDPALLLRMGQFTSLSIISAFQEHQRKLLLDLNALASEFIPQLRIRPDRVREAYLCRVFNLLRDALNIAGVSVFLKRDLENYLYCVASTGLCDSGFRKISPDKLAKARYPIDGASFTARCFQTGKILIVPAGSSDDGHTPQYHEITGTEASGDDPVLFLPLTLTAIGEPVAIGVVRLAGHSSSLTDCSRNFDPIEIQTATFIVHQVALILEMMSVSVKREQQVSIIKHDLYSPLNMVANAVFDLEAQLPSLASPAQASLNTLRLGVSMARNTVSQLDPSPEEVHEFDPQPTKLGEQLVFKFHAMLEHYARSQNEMSITVSGFDEDVELNLDSNLIERVFMNLVVNAVKYGSEGSTIGITMREFPGHYSIEISNWGAGVSQRDREFIFVSGYRGADAQRKPGLGLGLAISRSVMRRHGGDLILTQDAQPTIFSLVFPKTLKTSL